MNGNEPLQGSVPTAVAPVREGPGTRIGAYKLLQLLGEGGLGSVFVAEREQPVKRRVALKIIKLGMDTRQVVARFEQERQAPALSIMGLLALKHGDGPGAEAAYRRSLAIREKLLPEGSGIRGITMSGLGHALTLQGKYEEAEPLVMRGAEWVLGDPKAPGRNRKDAVDRTVALYEKWGKPDKAAEWKGRLPK